MQSKEELIAEIDKLSIDPPTDEQLQEFFKKVFTFLKDAIPNENFDRFIDKQLGKLSDGKIDGFDAVFAFIRAIITKI